LHPQEVGAEGTETGCAPDDDPPPTIRAAHNRGPEPATLHLLPSLWFRNTWSWDGSTEKPALQAVSAPTGAAWAIRADHPTLGNYHLYGRQPGELLFTGNETNAERLWACPTPRPLCKSAAKWDPIRI